MKNTCWSIVRLAAAGCVVARFGLAWSTAGAAEARPATQAAAGNAANLKVTFDWKKLNAEALEEYARPVRPGIKGPYWPREHDGIRLGFMYAPAFANFKPVEGAKCYRFSITFWDKEVKNRIGAKEWVFEAEKPHAALTPVWNDLPVCKAESWLRLRVEGLDGKGGKVIGVAENTRKSSQWALVHAGGLPRFQEACAVPGAV
jgi:hypothetical protein